MKTTVKIKNSCVKAICNCIDILICEFSNAEQIEAASVALKTILKNAMPFMRGEESAVSQVNEAVISAEKTTKKLENLPSDIFVDGLCEKFDFSRDYAHTIVVPALYRALADAVVKQKYESALAVLDSTHDLEETITINELAELDVEIEDETIYDGNIGKNLENRLKNVVNIFCRGESATATSKQIFFAFEVFGIDFPEFMGDDKTYETAKYLTDKLDDDHPLCPNLVEEMVFRIFHKVRLGNIVNYLNNKPTAKHKEILEELSSKYDIENNSEIFIDDPFYIKKKERSIFVKGLQKYTLETLILTKNFLDSHGLRFYLTEGTLLGAIRHKGFIPWDDDVDIAMPREDYTKLVQLAKEGQIPPELNFDSLENNPLHWVLGAKMQLVRETPYIQHKVTKLSKCNGPYVDIFPLDCWKRPFSFKQRFADICVKLSRRMLFIKTGYSTTTKKRPIRIFIKLLLPFISNKWIEKFAIYNMTKFHTKKPKYYVNLCSYYPSYKEVFPASFFGEPQYVEFEGEMMPVPCEYDYMLKTVYGKNYDTIPPVKVTNMRKHAFDLKENAMQNAQE